MCGIVGAVAQRDIAEILIEGLRRLEYRGYDSAGLAVVDNDCHMTRLREVGKATDAGRRRSRKHKLLVVQVLLIPVKQPMVNLCQDNAHPHVSGTIAVVHNGIIENYQELKAELINRGYQFASQTDTEVIAHLVNWEQRQGGTLREVVQRVIPQLRGAYGTVAVIMDSRTPELLVAARLVEAHWS